MNENEQKLTDAIISKKTAEQTNEKYFPRDVVFIIKDRETGKEYKKNLTWETISQLNALHDINAEHKTFDSILDWISLGKKIIKENHLEGLPWPKNVEL